jgi:hypothetical protein
VKLPASQRPGGVHPPRLSAQDVVAIADGETLRTHQCEPLPQRRLANRDHHRGRLGARQQRHRVWLRGAARRPAGPSARRGVPWTST